MNDTERKKVILVIDDEPDMLMVVAGRMRSLGVTVRTARNGEEGLRDAEKERPDLVVVDYKMPVMDGFEFCRRFRSDPLNSKARILLMTASAIIAFPDRVKDAGFDDFIMKPFDTERLFEKVKKLLEQAGQ